MIYKTVLTSNVIKATSALDTLLGRSEVEEGMGLFYGEPGEGKTTTVTYLVNRYQGVFLRASVTWTVTAMLQSLMHALKLEPCYRRAPMIDAAIDDFVQRPRPLFIDESDYLFRQTDMLDALRDLYDNAGFPVILIGMEEIERKVRSSQKLSRFKRRITQIVEFIGLSFEDTRMVANELCEVHIKDGLVGRLHAELKGNIGNIVIGISKIERFARANNLESVGIEHYGNKPLV